MYKLVYILSSQVSLPTFRKASNMILRRSSMVFLSRPTFSSPPRNTAFANMLAKAFSTATLFMNAGSLVPSASLLSFLPLFLMLRLRRTLLSELFALSNALCRQLCFGTGASSSATRQSILVIKTNEILWLGAEESTSNIQVLISSLSLRGFEACNV